MTQMAGIRRTLDRHHQRQLRPAQLQPPDGWRRCRHCRHSMAPCWQQPLPICAGRRADRLAQLLADSPSPPRRWRGRSWRRRRPAAGEDAAAERRRRARAAALPAAADRAAPAMRHNTGRITWGSRSERSPGDLVDGGTTSQTQSVHRQCGGSKSCDQMSPAAPTCGGVQGCGGGGPTAAPLAALSPPHPPRPPFLQARSVGFDD